MPLRGFLPGGQDEWTPDGYAAAVTQNMFGPMRLTMGCYVERLKASSSPGRATVVSTSRSVLTVMAFRLIESRRNRVT